MALYGGPYCVVNMWLTGYTWLQHSDETVPHYDEQAWDWMKGALGTIDRNYPNFINTLHYNIGSTHVLHHLFSYLPHYNAYEATLYLKQFLGDAYRYDERPVWRSLLEISKLSVAEQREKGVYYLISEFPYHEKKN